MLPRDSRAFNRGTISSLNTFELVAEIKALHKEGTVVQTQKMLDCKENKLEKQKLSVVDIDKTNGEPYAHDIILTFKGL